MKAFRRSLSLPSGLCLLALLAACEVGPDYQTPAAPAVQGYTAEPLPAGTTQTPVHGGEVQHFVAGQDISGQWWVLFHSDPLNRLVAAALKANPNLAAAQASLRVAQENALAERGALLPTLDGGVSAEREKLSGLEFGEAGVGSSIFSVTTASLSVSYPIDVFGGTRRELESLEAQADYQRFELEAAYLSLTANVVNAAIQEASLRDQIAATQQIINFESDALKVLNSQFTLGGVAKSDVLSQQATLAQEAAALPTLQKQLAQAHDLLNALTGTFPGQDLGADLNLSDLQLPQDLPVSLPSQLVAQRPDIRAADATLHAASAQVGVALSNELPQFSISGQYGTTAGAFGSLLSPGTGVWSLAGQIMQPLFDGGTLLHRERSAQASFDMAAAQYQATVIAAMQNVADSLRALQSDADLVRAETEAEQAGNESLGLSQQQFQLGAISYPVLLETERTYQQARIGLVQAQAARYSDTVALFQALGGGWWHRDDAAPALEADKKSSNDFFFFQGF